MVRQVCFKCGYTEEFTLPRMSQECPNCEDHDQVQLSPAWQPLETAPKDGTTILVVYRPLSTRAPHVTVGRWATAHTGEGDREISAWTTEGCWAVQDALLAWMPMPSLPLGL